MVRYLFLCIFSLFSCSLLAQTDSTEVPARKPLTYWQRLDSIKVAKAVEAKRYADSIRQMQDSLQMQWIGMPDPERPNLFLDSLKQLVTVKDGDFFAWQKQFDPVKQQYKIGAPKRTRDLWIIGVILALLATLALIRLAYPNEISLMIQGFYNNRVLSQISKEENLFNSWPFIFLYLLFGFTVGLFLYLVSRFNQLGGVTEGINLYLIFSASVIVLFTLKIVTLRFIGFLFDIHRLVREYVSILYLSYFNTALIFLPIVLIMAFSPRIMAAPFVVLALFVLVTIFLFQLLRVGSTILKTYSLSKFYLILYLCTLEIGPILILIRVLGF